MDRPPCLEAPTWLMTIACAAIGVCRLAADEGTTAMATARLEVRIIESRAAGEDAAVPARVHLVDAAGRPVNAPGLPFFRDHFNADGGVDLELAPGRYSYVVERGPEHRRVAGEVELAIGAPRRVVVRIERWIDMAARGWWSGETHVHRPLADVPLLMRSEDLHVATVLSVWNRSNAWRDTPLPAALIQEAERDRLYHVLAIEDERRGGALFFLNAREPIDLAASRPEFPSPVAWLERARAQGAWIEIEKPFWWDVPAWVASGQIDSIGVANNHMCRSTMYADEAWGRPRDASRLPPPRGNGFYSQEIWYRLLNCGFRIPPSAGSASGVLPNPVGYNRVYVHLDGEFSWDAWWQGLATGRSFVTNGPMLLVEANGKLPGAVFRAAKGESVSIVLDVRVDGNDPLEAVEVVRDGQVAERLAADELRGWHRPRRVEFERSGWFLVRAIAAVPETFRFASTAPFWVEIGDAKATIHRADVDFFSRWIDERIAILGRDEKGWLADPTEKAAVLAPHLRAREVFGNLAASAR